IRASVAGLPDSRTTISTIRSCFSTRSASARCTKRTRSSTASPAHPGCALRARSSAARTSDAFCTSISPMGSRVTGLEIASRRRAPGGTSIGVTMAMGRVYHRPVVEIFFLCARRAGLSHAEYAAHLLLRHAPLALRHHPRLRGYALHVVEESLGDSEPIDSVNALAFDSFADFAEHPYDSAEGERLVIEDHARFLGGAAGYAGRGQIHHDAQPGSELGVATPGTQWICALRRRARLSAARFHHALGSGFVPDLLPGQPGPTR